MLQQRIQEFPDGVPFCIERGNEWRPKTWREFSDDLRAAVHALSRFGLTRGDRLAIMAASSPVWETVHMAALWMGAVVVGIDPRAPVEQAELILAQSGASVLVGGEAEVRRLWLEVIRSLGFVATIGPAGGAASEMENCRSWEEESRLSRREPLEPSPALPSPVLPSDGATIIYTSGTTGEPKGILYRHEQVMLACQVIREALDPVIGERTVCWMPLSNLFQRVVNLTAILGGSTIYFVESPERLLERLPSINPSCLFGVPRLYEKVHAVILKRLRDSRPADEGNAAWEAVRSLLGSEIRALITGSAPAPAPVLQFFQSLGLPVLEAYGTSEDIVPIGLSRPDEFRLGSVGKPLRDNQVAVDADGEVLVKGPGVFTGYLHDSGSVEHFTADGYYRTGDIGYYYSDNLNHDGTRRTLRRSTPALRSFFRFDRSW